MVLNHEEIKQKNILSDFTENEFADGSYNLTIKEIINMDGKLICPFVLKPQGMVYVVFKEKLNMPSDTIGFAHVKTSLTKRGIMATNIGIIDPNYQGYLSTLLINFGKSDCFLSEGDPALRVTFAKINAPTTKKNLAQNNLAENIYLRNTQKNIVNLDDKFLNLSSVKKEVTGHIFKILLGLAIFFTAGNFALSAYFNHKSSEEKEVDTNIKKYELSLSTLIENNKFLQEQLKVNETKLKSMQDTLISQAKKIKKLEKK